MDRRRFLVTSLTGALTATARPLTAAGEEERRVPRVVVIRDYPHECALSDAGKAFSDGLRDLGYVIGDNIVVVWRCRGSRSLLQAVREQISLSREFDIAVLDVGEFGALANGVLPVLYAGGHYLPRVSAALSRMDAQRLETLKAMAPVLSHVALLTDGLRNHETARRDWEAAAVRLDLHLRVIVMPESNDLTEALRSIRQQRLEGIVVAGGTLSGHQARLGPLTEQYRLPAIFWWPLSRNDGGLMSLAADVQDVYRRLATRVDVLLKKERAKDVGSVTPKMNLSINRRTANALGLTIPPSLLARADQVIE